MKKEIISKENYKSNSRYKKERNLSMTRDGSNRFEVEEEAKTNANNGLPSIREYDQILAATNSHPFFLVQIVNKRTVKKGEKCNQYKIDVYLSALQIFYNRTLISRA